jgi:SWI/SNF-related matrix-associated actin-dependent regulator 1 of chromatin subfamily A
MLGYENLKDFQKVAVHFLEGKLPTGEQHRVLADDPGCVDGAALVSFNRAGKGFKLPLAMAYAHFHGLARHSRQNWRKDIPTYARCLKDGELRLGLLKDILYRGTRPVVKLILASGKELRVTSDHEVCTGLDVWRPAGLLLPGDKVLTNGTQVCIRCQGTENIVSYATAKFAGYCKQCVYRYMRKNSNTDSPNIDKDGYVTVYGQFDHPRCSSHDYGIYEHILVMEAHLGSYLIWPEQVHHKNEIRHDNRIENLELVTPSQHHIEHNKRLHLPRFHPKEDTVVSVAPDGLTDVYDIVMYDESHNFVANGIIVHNCGKTPVTCVALARKGVQSALIIVPAPHKDTWARHLVEWGVCHQDDIGIVRTRIDYPRGKFVIVSYELLLSEPLKRALMKKRFDVVVIDEAHRLKSPAAQITQIILGRKGPLVERAPWKIELSGTLMPNRPMELYTHLATLAPSLIKKYKTQEAFGKQYCGGHFDGRGMNYLGASNTEELAELCKPFMLRREIADVFQDLPPVLENEAFLEVGQLYASVADTPLATLRKIVGLAKLPHALDYILDRLSNSSDKLLIYAWHQEVIEGLHKGLEIFGAAKFYGPMTAAAKIAALQEFKTNNKCRVLIAQEQAAGTAIDGLQLVCNKIVRVELDWSDGGNRQSTGRLYRFLQDKPVYDTYMVALGTLDDRVLRSQYRKREVTNMFYSLINGDNTMSLDALLERFVVAVEKIAANGGSIQLNGEGNGKAETQSSAKAADSAVVAAAAEQTQVKEPSVDEVKAAALKALQKHGGKAPAKELVKSAINTATAGRADSTSKVAATDRAAVITALIALSETESDADMLADV